MQVRYTMWPFDYCRIRSRMDSLSQHRLPAHYKLLLLTLLFSVQYTGTPVFAQQETTPVIVDAAEEVALIEEVSLTGTVISPRVANLSTEVSGIVDAINVDIGDRVETGDEILHLNSELEELSLAAARAVTEQAEQELADAKRRLTDAKALAERQTVSANALESLAAEVRIDNAQVNRFRAEEQRQAARLRRHKLTAPFSGVINRKLVEQGEWIQPGQAVVELVATSNLRIDFQVPQSVYTKMDQATGVIVNLDAFSGQGFDGKIESVIPVNDPATRTFLIRVALDEPRINLAPGMSASAALKLKTGNRGVVVQRDAIMRYPDGRITVWVIKQENGKTTVSERQVQPGSSFDGKIAINSGLSPDALVVIQGNESLHEGQAVTVKLSE